MKIYKFTALVIILSILCTSVPLEVFAEEKEPVILHVSADARLNGTGSEEAPFQTIAAAQKALRSINHKKRKTEIVIHAGVYNFTSTLDLTAEDSGTENYPVVYRAAGDGEVRITGTTKLDVTDFKPVKNREILLRLPSEVRDKVGVMSLEKYGLDNKMFDISARYSDPREAPQYPYIYLNDKRQTLARWPNVGFETINTVISTGSAISGGIKGTKGIYNYNTMRPERWLLADQAQIRGYLGSEYCLDSVPLESVDTSNKTIVFSRESTYGVKTGHRWYIENLLEEIDSPGEFFVDTKTMELYFYPPKKLNKDDVLEVSTFNSSLITFTGCSNIELEGLKISDSITYGIYIENSENIKVRNCIIRNMGIMGIAVYNSKRCLVEGCTIFEIGKFAVHLRGGSNLETLSPSGNRVANNHFYNFATRNCMQEKSAINLGRSSNNTTIGDIVENNIIHGQPNAYAIIYGGVDNIIRYNEMFSVTNDAADMGVVYSGRRLSEFGNLIEYNYIHDYAPIFDAKYQIQGIYWDDLQSGQTAKHNIIVAGSKNRTAGDLIVGAYNNFSENIVVNSDIGVRMTDRVGDVSSTAYNTLSGAPISEALLKKYPQIAAMKKQLDEDDMFFNVQDNILDNNLSVDVNRNLVHDNVVARAISINNNQITDDYGVFVDPENHDYRLTTEAMEKFGFPETMINEKNFDMSQIGIQPEVFDVQTPESEFRLLYPTNGQKDVVRNTAYLKWEEALFADIYEYVVATDPELKNVVVSGKTQYTFVSLDNLENGKTYYYKVYAKNLSKQIGNEWESLGVPYMFTTTESDVLEKEFLIDEIASVKKLKAEIVSGNKIGDKIGEFKPEVIPQFDVILDEAEKMATGTTGQQSEIEQMVGNLKSFKEQINGYKHTGHAALDVTGEWLPYSANATITPTEKGVKIESAGGTMAILNSRVNNYEIQHFRMKVNFNGWTGITLRHADTKVLPYATGNKAYLVVLKPNAIECQKYNPAAPVTGIIKTCENNYIKDGEWCDVEFGAIDVIGGVEVLLKINGEEVFRFFDTEAPHSGEGYFTVFPGSEGAVVELEKAENVPEEEYIFTNADSNVTIYGSNSDIFESQNTWYDGTVKTVDNSAVKLSSDSNAKAAYTITDTLVAYKVAYYNKPYEGTDKNATVKIKYYSPTTGSLDEIVKTVDFSSGEEGWVNLGTYECASASKTGSIIVEFSGSGQGTMVAPVISAEKVTSDRLEFARLFYEYANNTLMMKVNSKTAYKLFDKLEIPDVAPYIENDITMVPLRFVAEAFDATVSWDDYAQKATVSKDGTNVEFVLGSNSYTVNSAAKEIQTPATLVNGRTMIPLRATAEALGKKVLWHEEKSMILIADEFAFKEDDTVKFDIAANGFERGY
ncbi:MAG: right-handed parallel beta-helix repeat-containing protein [Clostridia bacterium]|nr:right-handed parallel beta-helix repeat-containing protein [Clostridia bacterium]